MLPTLPIVAVTFGELSLIAPLSNLAAVFPSTLLVVSGCLAMVLDAVPFLGWMARGLLLAAGLVAKYLLGLTGGVASWRFATVSMTQPYLLVWLIGALLLMLLGYRLLGSRGLRRSAALSVIVLACGIGAHTVLMRGVTTVTTVPVGDSLALILERDGHAGLVAAGPDAYTLTGQGDPAAGFSAAASAGGGFRPRAGRVCAGYSGGLPAASRDGGGGHPGWAPADLWRAGCGALLERRDGGV